MPRVLPWVVAVLLLVVAPAEAASPRRVMVFGDSLAWGWIPQADGFPTTRFPAEVRWPGVLQTALGPSYEVIEEALNGRTTDLDPPKESVGMSGAGYNGAAYLPAAIGSQMPLDLVIVALGTNDLRAENHRTPLEVGISAVRLAALVQTSGGITGAEYPAPAVLLVAPPVIPLDVVNGPFGPVFGPEASGKSEALGGIYRGLAAAAGVPFLDAAAVVQADGVDRVHLTAQGHAALGNAVAAEVRRILPP
ncbi:MAG: GDSL-type esterase/lipase family protein [Geminicoccaceae bacterium]